MMIFPVLFKKYFLYSGINRIILCRYLQGKYRQHCGITTKLLS